MGELTPEAKTAIREAVDIVRADQQHKMLREIHQRTTTTPPPTPPTNPPVPPVPPGPTPPPPTDPPNPPADPPPPAKKSAYWGEIIA